MKTIFLHIGLEKTGTSSIQNTLEANRPALDNQGVFLPDNLGDWNHKRLAAYAFESGSRDISVVSCGVGETKQEVQAFRRKLKRQLHTDVKKSAADIGIFSSEDMSRLFRPEEIKRLVNLLRPLCEVIKVVVFVRRQDLLASSRYYSLVIGGSREVSILPNSSDGLPRFYNYAKTIDLWADAVGSKNILLTRFPERPSAERFDSTKEFFDVVGIDASKFTRPKKQHVSMDAINQIIIQNYNVTAKRFDSTAVDQLMAALAPYNDRRYTHVISEQQARDFYAHFHQANLDLFERVGRPDHMFSDDFSMYSTQNQRPFFQQKAISRLLDMLKSGAALS